jgi:hypothetical protein
MDGPTQQRVIEAVRSVLDERVDGESAHSFQVTVADDDGVAYMVSTAESPEAASADLYDCLAANVTAVATMLGESPAAVADRAGRLAAEREGLGEHGDQPAEGEREGEGD